MNSLNYNEKIFAAGFFEAAGGINTIYTHKETGVRNSRLIFSSKRRDSLTKLQTLTGIGKIYGPYTSATQGTYWRYSIHKHQDVIDFVDVISPYLSEDRQKYIQQRLDTTGWHVPKPPVEKPCLACGDLTTNPKFCSNSCLHLHRVRTTQWVKLQCDRCGKAVTRTLKDHQYRLQKLDCAHVYCSHKCAGAGPKEDK